MKAGDKFDEYTWDLTGNEYLTPWNHQTQKWYKTKRGLFLTTQERTGESWFATHSYHDALSNSLRPHWQTWDGNTLPNDIIDTTLSWDHSFDLIDIELAEMIMKGEL